jgi:hypothetical protein
VSTALNRTCRRARVAVLAPALVASVGAGRAAATPASAAVPTPHVLSAVMPCQAASDPGVRSSLGGSFGLASQPCWSNG